MILLTSAASASAARYWVAPGGNDANACTSVDGDTDPGVYRATPFGGRACLSGGDTLTIKRGTYTGRGAIVTSLPAGTANAHTVVEGDPGDPIGCAISSVCGVVFQPSGGVQTRIDVPYVTLRKIRIDHANNRSKYPLILGIGASNVRIQDIEAYNTAIAGSEPLTNSASGIYTAATTSFLTFTRVHVHDIGSVARGVHHGIYQQGDDVLIENSLFQNIGGIGVQCYASHTESDGRADRCKIKRSTFRNANLGIAIEGNDGQVSENLIYNNRLRGMSCGYGGGARRTKIHNNVFYKNGETGIRVGHLGNASDSQVVNNVVFGHVTEVEIDAVSGPTTGVILSHNACGPTDACGSTGKLAITGLTDIFRSNSDFRLKARSPAIDAGTATPLVACAGTCDIGAFQAVHTPGDSAPKPPVSLRTH